MRAYRFVNDLGEAANAASQAVAATADVTAAHHGGLGSEQASLDSRAGTELVRQLARETANREHERVRFDGRSVRIVETDRATHRPGDEIGLVIQIDLPNYVSTNVMLASVVHEDRLRMEGPMDEKQPVRKHIKSLFDRTSAAYVFLVNDDRTRAVPARSVLAMTDSITQKAVETNLYGRALGRFIEMLAEGFLGVDRMPKDPEPLSVTPADESTLRTWGTRHDLQGVCALSVTAKSAEAAVSLTPFLD